ncbi:hypothetical protein D3C85_1178890 [compost metagenome]
MALAQLGKPRLETRCQLAALFGAADALTYLDEGLRQLRQVARLHHQLRHRELLQLFAPGGADTVGPEQHQVGLEGEQAFRLKLAIAPHRRQAGQRHRAFAAVEHAHQQIGGAEVEHGFAEGRRQADHSQLRRSGQRQAQQQEGEQPAHQPSWRGIR